MKRELKWKAVSPWADALGSQGRGWEGEATGLGTGIDFDFWGFLWGGFKTWVCEKYVVSLCHSLFINPVNLTGLTLCKVERRKSSNLHKDRANKNLTPLQLEANEKGLRQWESGEIWLRTWMTPWLRALIHSHPRGSLEVYSPEMVKWIVLKWGIQARLGWKGACT